MTVTCDSCIERDATDPIAALRGVFVLPDDVTYLDGNPLGARPKAALAYTQEVVANEWGDDLIRSWDQAGWFELPRRLGDKLAPLIGMHEDEVAVTNTTSINLFEVLAAAVRVQHEDASARKTIVSETHNFSTDLYIAEGLTDLLCDGYKLRLIDSPEELEGALGDDIAVTMLTHVNYKGGHMCDMVAVSALAHKYGVLTIWGLAHSAGAVSVDLYASGVGYVIDYIYRYLNGGPGSSAFVWVVPALRERFWQPLSGWWGHVRPLAMESCYDAGAGIGRFLCGTQPITSMMIMEYGFDIPAQALMVALRAKSLTLIDLFIMLVETRCVGFPLILVTSRNYAIRGSHVSYEHPNSYVIVQTLIACGMVGDYRESRIMRFGSTPPYMSFADMWDVVEVLRDMLETSAWQSAQSNERMLVT